VKLSQKKKFIEDLKLESALKIEISERDEAQRLYEQAFKQVEKAIAETGLCRTHAGDFLRLAHDLVPATLCNADAAINLAEDINVISTLIQRRCTDKLTIDTYFEDELQLKLYIDILRKHGAIYMSDLICENEEEYEKEVLPILLKAREQEEEKQIPKFEKPRLRKAFIEPSSWQDIEKEKKETNQKILEGCAPTLALFFQRMNIAMTLVNELLSITGNSDLTEAQKLAIEEVTDDDIKNAIELANSKEQDAEIKKKT